MKESVRSIWCSSADADEQDCVRFPLRHPEGDVIECRRARIRSLVERTAGHHVTRRRSPDRQFSTFPRQAPVSCAGTR